MSQFYNLTVNDLVNGPSTQHYRFQVPKMCDTVVHLVQVEVMCEVLPTPHASPQKIQQARIDYIARKLGDAIVERAIVLDERQAELEMVTFSARGEMQVKASPVALHAVSLLDIGGGYLATAAISKAGMSSENFRQEFMLEVSD